MPIPPNTLWELQEVGKDLYAQGLVTSHGGNLSVRAGSDMWITGTGTMLGRLQERHIALVHANGRHEGPPPSSDTVLHAAIYALTPAAAVVHAHARHMTALSFALDVFVPPDFEGQYHLGEVPVIGQGPRQVELVALALQNRTVAFLRGHGAYARGKNLWEALHWVMALEESAQIEVLRRSIGSTAGP
jgi:L-fuculose-phosphate aldolase